MSFRITTLHAFTQIDENNREGVIGVRLGDTWYPLVSSDRERLEYFRRYAWSVAHRTRRPVRLTRFAGREDLDVIESSTAARTSSTAEAAGQPSVAAAMSSDAQAQLTEPRHENEQLRRAMAYEARVVQAHYDDKKFPKSRRAIAEEQIERMRRVAVGDPFREYAGVGYLERYLQHARALLPSKPIETLPVRLVLVHQGEPDVAQPPRSRDGRRR